MTSWFVRHEFLAAWLSATSGCASALIALVAMVKSQRSGTPIKWNQIVLRVGFLLCLSGILSPATDSEVRKVLQGFGIVTVSVIIWHSYRE